MKLAASLLIRYCAAASIAVGLVTFTGGIGDGGGHPVPVVEATSLATPETPGCSSAALALVGTNPGGTGTDYSTVLFNVAACDGPWSTYGCVESIDETNPEIRAGCSQTVEDIGWLTVFTGSTANGAPPNASATADSLDFQVSCGQGVAIHAVSFVTVTRPVVGAVTEETPGPIYQVAGACPPPA